MKRQKQIVCKKPRYGIRKIDKQKVPRVINNGEENDQIEFVSDIDETLLLTFVPTEKKLHIKAKRQDGDPGASWVNKRLNKKLHETTIDSKDLKMLLKLLVKRIEKSDRLKCELTEEELKDALTIALDEILDDNDNAMETIKEMREKEQEEIDANRMEELYEKAEMFQEYLEENHLTVFSFLNAITEWLLINEQQNILASFMAYMLTITGFKPIWVMFFSKSGDGKSAIVDATLELIPEKYVISGTITEAALLRKATYAGNDYLDRKIVNFRDMGGDFSFKKWEATLDIIKEMSTEGKSDKEIVGESLDPNTGEKVNLPMSLIGYPAATFSSVHSDNVQEQYETRGINLTPKATGADVIKYREYMRKGTKTYQYRHNDVGQLIEMFKEWLELQVLQLSDLKDSEYMNIINPYNKCLSKWIEETPNVKRESEMFPLMLNMITYLNKDQRQTTMNGDIIATREDVMILTELFKPSNNLTSQELKFYGRLIQNFGKLDNTEYDDYNSNTIPMKDVKTFFNVSRVKRSFHRESKEFKDKIGAMLNNLEEEGYIEKMEEQDNRGHNIYYYTEIKPYEQKRIEFTPELIEAQIQLDTSEWGYNIDETEYRTLLEAENTDINYETKFIKQPPWITQK